MSLKAKQAFGPKPVIVSAEADDRFSDAAADGEWGRGNRDAQGATIAPGTAVEVAQGRDVVPTGPAAPMEPGYGPKGGRRPSPTSQEFKPLTEEYTQQLLTKGFIDEPPNALYVQVKRHRLYTMCPVDTAASLQAYSDARGFNSLWLAIDELLRMANVYTDPNDQSN